MKHLRIGPRTRSGLLVLIAGALLGTVATGCSQPASAPPASPETARLPSADEAAIAPHSTQADWRGVRYVPAQTPSELEIAEHEIIDEPNSRFFGSGRLMEPSQSFEELPILERARDKKPGPNPPVFIDRLTRDVSLAPADERAALEADVLSTDTPTAPTARTPALTTSFEGMTSQSAAPGDPDMAVGPDTLVQAVNDFDSVYRLYDKTGAILDTATQDAMHGTTICCDARTVFDAHSQRYFLATLVNSCTPTIALAMSKSASPTNLDSGAGGPNDWLAWTFTLPGSNRLPDFPILGVDENAVYLTGNVFSCGSGIYRGVNLVVIPKAQLLAAAVNPTSTTFTNLTETWSGQNFQAFSVIPPVSFSSPGVGILAEITASGTINDGVTDLDANVLTLYVVDDPATPTPTLSDFPVFTQPTGFTLPNAPQSGSAALIETNDPSLHGITYRDGSLWVSQTVENAFKTAISWDEIDPFRAMDPATFLLGWEQGGLITHATRYYYFSKITADAGGNAALVMNASSSSEFASVYYATRASDDPANTFQAPALMKAGIAVYDNPARWGDYSGIGVDPTDEMSFWATSQWAKTNNGAPNSFDRWSTWIGEFALSQQTTTLPFFEDFESSRRAVTSGLWSLITGTVDDVGSNEPSGSDSARINGPPRGQDQFRTRQIDLSAAESVEVSYWLERGGNGDPPEVADLLSVDYVNSDGNWATLQTFFGTGASESDYTPFTHTLPADALHEHFRLRFTGATSFTLDDWFVDDVGIRECSAADVDTDGVGDLCDSCIDADSDGYGQSGFDQSGCTFAGDDCDDSSAGVNPAAVEVCDLVDTNCDGVDGTLPDSDADGVGNDCDACPDEPALVDPTEPAAEVTCADAIDNDCDGDTDEADADCASSCRCGDFDMDDVVNLDDFATFAGCFNEPPATPGCECTDLNLDGMINLIDFALFARAFGQSSTFFPPDCP